MEKKSSVGRPMKFKSVKELQEKIDAYFAKTPLHEQTITGLALFLGTSRETLCDYQARDKYSDTIKKAKLRVEHACELVGVERGRPFDIFRLKNMGWKDKQESDVNLSAEFSGEITIQLVRPDESGDS